MSPSLDGAELRSLVQFQDGGEVAGGESVRLQDPRVDQLRKAGMPFVTIGHTAHPDGVWWVDVDYQGLVGRCVKHLADLGHRNVALINRSAEMLASGYGPGLPAWEGFRDAISQSGLTGFEYPCADDAPAGDACMALILEQHPEVTAAVTVNEAALPGFQRALQRAGLRVPADFSLIGVAAQHWAEEFHPPLTSADVPASQMGTEAMQLLTEHIAEPAAPAKHLLLSPPISLRDSVSRARALERG